MAKVCGFAFFFLAVGMIISCLVEGFIEFLLIVVFLAAAYLLFCRC